MGRRSSSRLAMMVVSLLMSATATAAPLEQVTVFERGESGYHTFRIPAMTRATDGTLLAFAEGRRNSGSDTGNIDLVLKRSTDGGKTWGPLQVIGNNGGNTFGNPVPLVDRSTDRVILVTTHNLGQDAQDEISDGTSDGTRTVWVQHSEDHGATWSVPREITASVKGSDWRWYATGPGHGIQLERGEHAGRLIVPMNYNAPGHNGAGVIYSDDGGETWRNGDRILAPTNGVRPSESSAVELVDGRLYLNSRNRSGNQAGRGEAYSDDGGETFTDVGHAETLIDPVVQGSTVRYSAIDMGADEDRILFSNPAHLTERRRMTIRSSFDETATWTDGKLVHRGPSAYSDLVRTATGGGLLYENGGASNYQRITFAGFDSEWLDDPTLMQIDFRDGTANDQRGNGVNGTLLGNPTFIDGPSSYTSDTALRFDGVDDRVRVADTAYHLFDFEETDSFVIEVVFRTTSHDSGGSGGSGPLLAKDVGPNTPSYWLRIQDGKLRFFLDDGESSASVTSTGTVTDGEWRHVAVVVDRDADAVRLYVDHVLVGVADGLPTGSLANSNDLLIGAFNDSGPGNRRFAGDIALVRISAGALGEDAFVQPIPEPASLTVAGAAAAMLWRRRTGR